MPQGILVRNIAFHRRRAGHFHRTALRRRGRAQAVAAQALMAQKNGRPRRAQKLMERALLLTAAAARAGVRARIHRARIVELRQARAQH